MMQVGDMKFIDFEETLDRDLGPVGTPRRDEFERNVDESVHAYNTEIMKENKIQFTRPLGAFKDSVMAYRAYKQKWQQRVNEELEERERKAFIATAKHNASIMFSKYL